MLSPVIFSAQSHSTSELLRTLLMSGENYVGIIMTENLRFLGEVSSAQGKSGAKLRPRGVGDAHTVEIP